MLIGLDAIPLTEPLTGVGHYTFELAQALARVSPSDKFELAYPSSLPRSVDEGIARSLPPNLRIERVQAGPVTRHWWSLGLPRYAARRGFGLFHGTNYDVPLWRPCATVLSVHDLSLFSHPETHVARRVRRGRRRLPLMLRLADAVVTMTESVRRELTQRFQTSAGKVFVVPEAARECFSPMEFEETAPVRERLGVGDEFLLAVGTIEPRKNLATLLNAFEEVVRAEPGGRLQLVVAGNEGWLSGPLLERFGRSGVAGRLRLTGYLQDEALRALYSSCCAFVYPSLYEGFGLPPLEAMRCGAPVIASRIPALTETTGGAARLFDPHDPQELARAILELVRDPAARSELTRRGRLHVRKFSWETTARLTLDVYTEALSRFGRSN